MKKTTLALGMHDKLFKRARTMYRIEHRICDLLMTKGFLRIETPTLEHFEVLAMLWTMVTTISLIKMEILLAYVRILPAKLGA